jgi:hypothetical protein
MKDLAQLGKDLTAAKAEEKEVVDSWEKEVGPWKKAYEEHEAPWDRKLKAARDKVSEAEQAIREYEFKTAAQKWVDRAPATGEEFVEWLHAARPVDGERIKWSSFYTSHATGRRLPDVETLKGLKFFGAADGEHGNRVYVAFNEAGHATSWMEVEPSDHPGDRTIIQTLVVNGKTINPGSAYGRDAGDNVLIVNNYSGVKQPLKSFFGLIAGEYLICWEDPDHTAPRSKVSHRIIGDSDEEPLADYKRRITHRYAPKSAVEAWLLGETKGHGDNGPNRAKIREICGAVKK